MISTSARGSASFASTQARAVLDGVRQDAARIVAHDAHRLTSSGARLSVAH